MKRVGILGGGQLGRMLALAGVPLGLEFRFYDPAESTPVSGLGTHNRAPWDDAEALEAFAKSVDVISWEFENVPVSTVELLAKDVAVYPSPVALETAQDRLFEKERFTALGIPTNDFRSVESAQELAAAVEAIGLPAVLKTRRMGYDGKGQQVLREVVDPETVWREMGEVPCLLEAFVPFDRELSLVGVRGRGGETRFYPLVQNTHVEGILHRTVAPAADVTPELQAAAEQYLTALLDDFGYVGVLAIEFFQTGQGLIANEIAPRVHNSGHWTQDGAVTSQFENHLRAVLGLPLGETSPRGHALMLNLIGDVPDVADVFFEEGARLHLYGKEARPGRKLGHVNIVGDDARDVELRAGRVEAAIPIV